MGVLTSLALLGCFVCACFYVLVSNSRRRKLPPGPYPFPIIGNILQLGQNPHHSLANLSKIYGPIMYLKFGSMNTIVITSPKMAKTILQKHEHAFTRRSQMEVTQVLGHDQLSLIFGPAGDEWRRLRNICKEHMFSNICLDASQGLRQKELLKLRDYLEECSVSGLAVDISKAVFVTTVNLISNTLFSLDFAGYKTGSSQEMHEIVRAVVELWGVPNLADYFPILKFVDLQGIKREAEKCYEKLFALFDSIIDQRLESASAGCSDPSMRNDFLEALLNLSQRNPSEMTREGIKHLLLDIFVAGIDTTSSTVGWAMTELLRNPYKLSKAKIELTAAIGHKQLEESNILDLPYMQAIIKETLRYHPPVPLIFRVKEQGDLETNGYRIPSNAQILINIWAIHRDSSVWSNPDTFQPERFIDHEIDIKGQAFELIPFGSGRRICLGMSLANRMTYNILASLIHSFDWKLAQGIKPDEIDITEKFGATLEKAVPLRALPIKV